MISFIDMNNDVTPTPLPLPLFRSPPGNQGLLEGIVGFIAIGAVVIAVLDGLDSMTTDHLDRRVDLEQGGVGTVDPGAIPGYRLDVSSATLVIEDPSVPQRLAVTLPMALTALTVGAAATLLWQIARSIREGDLFHHDNAMRLRHASTVVTGSLIALPISLVLSALSEIFRRGAALRDDAAGLV